MKSGINLAIGALIAVIALIFYERKQSVAATHASGQIPTVSPTIGVTLQGPNAPQLKNSPAPLSTLNAAAQRLPQFSQAADPSVVDISAVPTFDGKNWTCPNGDIPYYDASTQSVYCVLPGVQVSQFQPIGDESELTSDPFGGEPL